MCVCVLDLNWTPRSWSFSIHHVWLHSFLLINGDLSLSGAWCQTCSVSGLFYILPASISFNVTWDRNGISECKSTHCSFCGAHPPKWLSASCWADGWGMKCRKKIRKADNKLLTGSLKASQALPFHTSLSLPLTLLSLLISLILQNYWINDETQSGSAITPVFCFSFHLSACVAVS